MANKGEGKKTFDCVIVGTGGQGLITLLEILADAGLKSGFDVKTSELHGLSQRGGSVEVHIKFGKKVWSPLVEAKKAELIVGLEMQECLKAAYFAGPETQYLINKTEVMIPGKELVSPEEIVEDLQKVTKKIVVVNADEICKQELGSAAVSGVYLLCLASFKKMLPLKPETMLEAIKSSVSPKHLELNIKTWELAKKNKKN
ncbi:MAG: indolepyruvate oxidoreductase subunit beta [Candidatus Pacebacteria bacterium]|jgi:indolepyruvate ferredoxin oxidoreductase beta subunit|nr:indolepyruvate oxidoreductase subunit beta [Candidatus Paceibacterota bacterium]